MFCRASPKPRVIFLSKNSEFVFLFSKTELATIIFIGAYAQKHQRFIDFCLSVCHNLHANSSIFQNCWSQWLRWNRQFFVPLCNTFTCFYTLRFVHRCHSYSLFFERYVHVLTRILGRHHGMPPPASNDTGTTFCFPSEEEVDRWDAQTMWAYKLDLWPWRLTRLSVICVLVLCQSTKCKFRSMANTGQTYHVTLTFNLGGHDACRWCESISSICTPTLKFLCLTVRKTYDILCVCVSRPVTMTFDLETDAQCSTCNGVPSWRFW